MKYNNSLKKDKGCVITSQRLDKNYCWKYFEQICLMNQTSF